MKLSKVTLLKMSTFFIVACFVILFVGVALKFNTTNTDTVNAVETKNGIQFISLKAGLGYSPSRIQASASVPTKLEIQTNNTYDCTAFLNIPKLNIKKFLPPTGTTEISIEGRAPGDEIEGFCGSNTYKFVIHFS